MEIDNPGPQVRIDPEQGIVIRNRAYRRRWKSRAQMEGQKSKKFYTTKRKSRRK